MTTVVHFISTNFFGGPERQIVNHARMLDKTRFRFVLVSFVEHNLTNELLEKARQMDIDVFEIATSHPFDPRSIVQLRDILKGLQADILCSHGYKANVLGRLASWLVGIPHVSVSRGWTGENSKIRYYELLDKFFLHLADHIVAVSHGQANKLFGLRLKSERVSVIHNAIHMQLPDSGTHNDVAIRDELGVPSNSILVASAGRLSPEKNYGGLIDVAHQVCGQRKDVYFAVFGEGFLRQELESKIKSLGLKSHFFLPGFRRDIHAIFQQIDIFILPSFTEGLPNVVLEAYAAQKPVIASAVGGTPEVVQHDATGLLTAPDDIQGLAQYVVDLASDETRRKNMGEAGCRYVAEHFSYEQQTKKYQELYDELCSRQQRGACC